LAYRKLEQTFPDSAEARAALVSLGQLQLGQLGQPEAALRSFRAYLAAPGQLQQEAEHGSILALQKLGRKAEERRAIEAFVARYPKSVQAVALKERLEQL
jgi:TolA-binding protein